MTLIGQTQKTHTIFALGGITGEPNLEVAE